MSKNLKAFLNKNKKKPAKEADPKQKQAEETKVQAEVEKVEQKVEAVKKDDSSDSEVDDQDLDNHQYGKIVENKDVAGPAEDEQKGFGYDDTVISGPTKKAAEKEKKKATGGDISFNFKGAKPSFSRKPKGKFAEFNEGLNDMDDDGNIVKRAPEKRSNAEGGREFINLGSSAKQGGPPLEQKESKGPRKPTFTGRMNLKGTGEPVGNSDGVTKSYGFQVTYKTNKTEEEKGEEKPAGEKREQKKQRQLKNEKGMAFDDFVQKEGQSMDDDGFQVVRRKDRKKPAHQKNDDSDSAEEGEGFKITRGEKRGGFRGGRGGRS